MNDISSSLEERVLTLTLNRPKKKNAITPEMYSALAAQLERATNDPEIRVAVLQGGADIFCAGRDLVDLQKASDSGLAPLHERPAGRFLQCLIGFPKPLVASVCGLAIGVGATMLLHFDLIYAGNNAVFSFPFVNLGLIPEAGSTLLLPRLLGYTRAAEVLLTGGQITAAAASEMGLVNRVVDAAECNAFTATKARALAAKPLESLVETKRLLRLGRRDALQERLRCEGDVFGRLSGGAAAREAFAAFAGKRKPNFDKV